MQIQHHRTNIKDEIGHLLSVIQSSRSPWIREHLIDFFRRTVRSSMHSQLDDHDFKKRMRSFIDWIDIRPHEVQGLYEKAEKENLLEKTEFDVYFICQGPKRARVDFPIYSELQKGLFKVIPQVSRIASLVFPNLGLGVSRSYRFIPSDPSPFSWENALSKLSLKGKDAQVMMTTLDRVNVENCIRHHNDIRAELGLHPSTIITNGLAKQAIVQALFSSLRQTSLNCYSVAFANAQLVNFPLIVVKDLVELLNHGYLTRTLPVRKKEKRVFEDIKFPASIFMSWFDLEVSKFNIDRNGFLKDAPFKRWYEMPLFHNAWQAQEAKPLRKSNLDTSDHNWNRFLLEDNNRHLYAHATHSSPLIRIWCNTITAMAASADNDLKTRLIQSLMNLVADSFEKFDDTMLEDQKLFLLRLLDDHLQTHIIFQCREFTAKNCYESCFVPLYHNNTVHGEEWFVIDSFSKLKTAWPYIVDQALSEVNQYNFEHILSENIIRFALKRPNAEKVIYNAFDKKDRMDKQEYLFSGYSHIGDLIQGYYQLEKKPLTSWKYHRSVEQLLVDMILRVRNYPKKYKDHLRNHPEFYEPVEFGNHSCNWFPAKLLPAAESDLTPKEWIRKNLIEPGNRIVNIPMPEDIRQIVIAKCVDIIIDYSTNSNQTLTGWKRRREEQKSRLAINFLNSMNELPPTSTYQEFRNKALHFLKNIPYIKSEEEIALDLDCLIIRNLPLQDKKELKNSGLLIGDSNYGRMQNSEMFCFILAVNPGSGKLNILETTLPTTYNIDLWGYGTFPKGYKWELLDNPMKDWLQPNLEAVQNLMS